MTEGMCRGAQKAFGSARSLQRIVAGFFCMHGEAHSVSIVSIGANSCNESDSEDRRHVMYFVVEGLDLSSVILLFFTVDYKVNWGTYTTVLPPM